MRLVTPLFMLAGIAAWPLAAQAPAVVTPGSEVRVVRIQPGGGRAALARGRLQRLASDTAEIRVGADSTARMTLGPDRVLEVRTGSRRRVIAAGVAGALVGLAIGAVVGANAEPECPGGCLVEGGTTISAAAVGGLVGMLLGGLVGSQITSPIWTPVPVAARLTFFSLAGVGRGAGLQLRF